MRPRSQQLVQSWGVQLVEQGDRALRPVRAWAGEIDGSVVISISMTSLPFLIHCIPRNISGDWIQSKI